MEPVGTTNSGLGVGAYVGIAIGGLCALIGVGALAFFLVLRRTKRHTKVNQSRLKLSTSLRVRRLSEAADGVGESVNMCTVPE